MILLTLPSVYSISDKSSFRITVLCFACVEFDETPLSIFHIFFKRAPETHFGFIITIKRLSISCLIKILPNLTPQLPDLNSHL